MADSNEMLTDMELVSKGWSADYLRREIVAGRLQGFMQGTGFVTSLRLPCLQQMVDEESSLGKGRELRGEHDRGPSTVKRWIPAGGDSAMILVGEATDQARRRSETRPTCRRRCFPSST